MVGRLIDDDEVPTLLEFVVGTTCSQLLPCALESEFTGNAFRLRLALCLSMLAF